MTTLHIIRDPNHEKGYGYRFEDEDGNDVTVDPLLHQNCKEIINHNNEIADEWYQRAKADEAEAARLRDLVEEFLEGHPSGEHWQDTSDYEPAGWCTECLAEWPCLVERARVALHGEEK